ncbi:MAG: hypothetical protein ACI8Q9_001611 [Planctomycetota bacterium]|jgi:hypothetical protein
MIDRSSLSTLLISEGYRLQEASPPGGFFECILTKNCEFWSGRGDTAERALEAAARAMCPSDLAWRLLLGLLDGGAGSMEIHAPRGIGHIDLSPGESKLPVSMPPKRPVRELDGLDEPTALAELSALRAELDEEAAEASLWAPTRQRLWMMRHIAMGRAIGEAAPSSSFVKGDLQNLAGTIGKLARTWWPGSIQALQISAIPRDCGRDLGLRGDDVPQSWLEVVIAAERCFDALESRESETGLDQDGWSDAAALQFPHPDPKAAIQEVRTTLETITAPLDEKFDPRVNRSAIYAPVNDDTLIRTAQVMRWLRGTPEDTALWGALFGRLRQLQHKAPERLYTLLRDVIDPAYSPDHGWSSLLGIQTDGEKLVAQRQELVRGCPATSSARPSAVLDWLLEALEAHEVISTVLIAKNLEIHRDLVLGLNPESYASGRRLRRRLTRVQTILRGEASAEQLAEPEPTPLIQLRVQTSFIDEQLAAVREHTAGKRALLVSNRNDPDQESAITETFGFADLVQVAFDSDGIGSTASHIETGAFDFVLSVTGVQNHGTDHALAAAAKVSGAVYSRVYRGRRFGCIRALYRDVVSAGVPA